MCTACSLTDKTTSWVSCEGDDVSIPAAAGKPDSAAVPVSSRLSLSLSSSKRAEVRAVNRLSRKRTRDRTLYYMELQIRSFHQPHIESLSFITYDQQMLRLYSQFALCLTSAARVYRVSLFSLPSGPFFLAHLFLFPFRMCECVSFCC